MVLLSTDVLGELHSLECPLPIHNLETMAMKLKNLQALQTTAGAQCAKLSATDVTAASLDTAYIDEGAANTNEASAGTGTKSTLRTTLTGTD